jgi:hypothetical protein
MRNQMVRSKWLGVWAAVLAASVSFSCGGGMMHSSQSGGNTSSSLFLNTSNIDFGNVSLGGSKSNSITLTNSSASAGSSVTFSQVNLSGTGFTVTTAPLPITLGPGQASTLTVTFAPKSAGAVTGNLSVVVAGATTQAAVALSGTGLGPSQLAVSPASLDFGSVAVGNTLNKTGTLTAGSSSISVSGATLGGQGYSLSGIAFPLTIAAGKSVSYSATFTPSSAASFSGSISFVSNAANSPAIQNLTGSGTQAPGPAGASQLTVSPSVLAFGNVAVDGTSSKTGTLTAGSSNVTVASAAWSGSGYSVGGITFPVTIAAGKSVTYTVTFSPTIAGNAPGSISFVSNASNSPANQSFTGAATQSTTSTHSVSLIWNASNSQVAGYNIYRGTQTGGPYSRLNPAAQPDANYTDSTVLAGTTYFYVTTAVDAGGAESSNSNEATAVVPTP